MNRPMELDALVERLERASSDAIGEAPVVHLMIDGESVPLTEVQLVRVFAEDNDTVAHVLLVGRRS